MNDYSQTNDFIIMDCAVNNTCGACPEQYDVFNQDGTQIGYIRLRHGCMTASYPDVGGEDYISINTQGDGDFSSAVERQLGLGMAVSFVLNRHCMVTYTGSLNSDNS